MNVGIAIMFCSGSEKLLLYAKAPQHGHILIINRWRLSKESDTNRVSVANYKGIEKDQSILEYMLWHGIRRTLLWHWL